VDEIGVHAGTDRVLVRIDPHYFRPTEVDQLIGDASKAKRLLDWEAKTTFATLVTRMVASDLEQAKREVHIGNYMGA
jgi:GDPmannose 4,6-dehydratase